MIIYNRIVFNNVYQYYTPLYPCGFIIKIEIDSNYGDKRFLTNQTECFEYCDKEHCMGWDENNERCRLIIKNDT